MVEAHRQMAGQLGERAGSSSTARSAVQRRQRRHAIEGAGVQQVIAQAVRQHGGKAIPFARGGGAVHGQITGMSSASLARHHAEPVLEIGGEGLGRALGIEDAHVRRSARQPVEGRQDRHMAMRWSS